MPRLPSDPDLSPQLLDMEIPPFASRCGMSAEGTAIRAMEVSKQKMLWFPLPPKTELRRFRERLSRICQHTKAKLKGREYRCYIIKRGVEEGVGIWRTA